MTTMTTTTMNGSDGPYHLGIEYLITADHVCRAILRPARTEHQLGRAIVPGEVNPYGTVTDAITVVAHDGEPSEWRAVDRDGEVSVARKPEIPPYLGLPDEEHGYSWGDPIALPSSEPARYRFAGREIAESEAMALLSGSSDTTTIQQPAPAPAGETMVVGTGDAKGLPPGLAEAMADDAPEMDPGWEDRAVERARREGVLPPR